ncbi:hypothetical protein [Stappia sp. ES.058]|uniref:TsoY family (seleno)protein n=1 Tax=Stappia sp. ES.058 TaxID=1881061 RepID=UPI00087DC227|nr:hypothetical protein [Stappia sp. ES.058]SDU25963.1 Voltage-dependent anion channel [Stappia sp. ES.058]
MRYASNLGERYSPLYFLSSLGAGGLSVAFFMFLMWMTPHKGTPIPTFDTLMVAFLSGSLAMKGLIAVGYLGVAVFAAIHMRTLVWNLREYALFRKGAAYRTLRSGNGETQLMTVPLTLAMTVNAAFIVGALFVPGLWAYVEYLFPVAIAVFLAIGVYAMRIFTDFLSRVLTSGGFDCASNNSFGQMLSVFAFAMVGVGLSAPAAMSHSPAVTAIATMLSLVFIVAALVFGAIMLVLGFRAMMEHAASLETTPTLWILIPIVTVLGIALYRLNMGLAHTFGAEWHPGSAFFFLATLFAVQILFGVIGYAVMRRFGYFDRYVSGDERSPGSFALICPGVALWVFGNFVINAGLVRLGVVERFSPVWFLLYLPLALLLVQTIRIYFRLNARLLGARPGDASAAQVSAA